jgi:hypothetical protein
MRKAFKIGTIFSLLMAPFMLSAAHATGATLGENPDSTD